jgi:hypothetical protein
MRRLRELLSLPHQLEVRFVRLSVGGPHQVFVRLRTRRVRLAYLGLALAFGGTVVSSIFTTSRLTTLLMPAVVLLVVSEKRNGRRALVGDELLAQAITRAALNLGREVKPDVWRIDGDQAKEIGLELHRLKQWRPALDPAAGPVAEQREALLMSAATGPLQVDSTSHMDGDPWPILEQPEPEWPVWPRRFEQPGGTQS